MSITFASHQAFHSQVLSHIPDNLRPAFVTRRVPGQDHQIVVELQNPGFTNVSLTVDLEDVPDTGNLPCAKISARWLVNTWRTHNPNVSTVTYPADKMSIDV